MQAAGGLHALVKDGTRHLTGRDEALLRNIDACKELSKLMRTSLGPNGMNKILINHLDKIFLTSDCATIMSELEVQHPAAKLLVEAARMQDAENGDGTNLVVSFGGELLARADELLRIGLHPSEIIAGYAKAATRSAQLLEELIVHKVSNVREEEQLITVLKSVLGSKQPGHETLLASLVARAALTVMPNDPTRFNVDNVRVGKVIGAGVHMSQVIKGMVLPRDTEGTIKSVTNAKVAVYANGLDLPQSDTKGTVLLTSDEQLKNYAVEEEKRIEEYIRGISKAGVKVIVSGNAVGELAQHFCERFQIMVIKCPSKFDLQRLCRAVGATAIVRFGPPLPEELGECDSVKVTEVGSQTITVFRQDNEDSGVATLLLRGSTENLMDDVSRAIDDGVSAVKATCKDQRFVAGAGACEIEIARRLREEASRVTGMDQYAMNAYAEALEIVPRVLAENAGQDATAAVTKLYAAHEAGQRNAGVNVEDENGSLADAVELQLFDHMVTKREALRLASDAALTVLRVDQIIMSKPAGGPKAPQQGAADD